MGTTERRQREREEIRARILDAARELFSERGYEAVTMRDIAKRIEYSATALYFHFKDKEALMWELCATDFRGLAQNFTRLARVADPIERLRLTGYAYVDFGLTHPHHYRLMFMTPHPEGFDTDPQREGAPQHGNPEEDAYAFLLHTVREALTARRFKPEFKDAEALAQLLWAGAHGVVSLRIAKSTDAWVRWRPAKKTARQLIDAILAGVVRAGK